MLIDSAKGMRYIDSMKTMVEDGYMKITKIEVCRGEIRLYADADGAVCVTDKSNYLTEHFADGDTLRYYDLKNLSELPSAKGVPEHMGM